MCILVIRVAPSLRSVDLISAATSAAMSASRTNEPDAAVFSRASIVKAIAASIRL